MTINLNDIELKLKWVNFKHDKTDRKVSLQKILTMDKDQRSQLHFINDFETQTITMVNRKDLLIEVNEFVKPGNNVGFVYFSNTDHCGVFYEAVFLTESLEEFNAIKQAYFNQLK